MRCDLKNRSSAALAFTLIVAAAFPVAIAGDVTDPEQVGAELEQTIENQAGAEAGDAEAKKATSPGGDFSDLESIDNDLSEALEQSFTLRPEIEGPDSIEEAKDDSPQEKLPWLEQFDDARRQAERVGRPILVDVGAPWCAWCKKLEEEFAQEVARKELARWTLLRLDADDSTEEVRSLNVTALPALRILTPRGELVASQDGFMTAADLAAWLESHYDDALQISPGALTDTSQPTEHDLKKLAELLGAREAPVREAAIARLTAHPEVSRPAVVAALSADRLAVQLSALEVLQRWKAPVERLDPWRPETLAKARLVELDRWATTPLEELEKSAELDEEELAEARREIDRLLSAPAEEVPALLTRLARYGETLSPEVYARLEDATSDEDRSRLTALRYHLVASNKLILGWSTGLADLSSSDLNVRRSAAGDLVSRAGAEDQPLLLELFSNSDPLIRELAIKALREVGGTRATNTLVKLLEDPDPNVRAAVLKQLAEAPVPSMVPHVAKYLEKETDTDLIVHAVRFLRETPGNESAEAIVSVAEHSSWQVRAEVAEAAKKVLPHELSGKQRGKLLGAVLILVEDEDGFVVSRAIEALQEAEHAPVKLLAGAVEQFPQLASVAIGAILENSEERPQVIDRLRGFAEHENAVVRAAALAGLHRAGDAQLNERVLAGLKDSEARVRLQAAEILLAVMATQRPQDDLYQQAELQFGDQPQAMFVEEEKPGFVERFFGLFGGGKTPEAVPESAPVVLEAEPTVAARQQLPEGSPPEPLDDDEGPAEAIAADVLNDSNQEEWLVHFRSGEERPSWFEEAIHPLQDMLDAKDPTEQVASAICLVGLGHDDPAHKRVLKLAGSHPTLTERAATVLPWLPIEQRLDTFHTLRDLESGPEYLDHLVGQLTVLRNPAVAEVIWELLAKGKIEDPDTSSLIGGLRRAYFGDPYYNVGEAPRPVLEAVSSRAEVMAERGTPRQKITALTILLSTDAPLSATLATAVFEDPATPPTLLEETSHVLLLALPSEAEPRAVELLTHETASVRRTAIRFLARGGDAIRSLPHSHVYLSYDSPTTFYSSSDGPRVIVPEPPKGMEAGPLWDLLADEDPEVAAMAAHFLTLLDEPEGMEPLLAYWREMKPGWDQEQFAPLVYRSIAYLNSEEHVPILTEIHERYAKDDSWFAREFYWTIRIMTGPEVLKLRKRIRADVGMSNLRF